MKSLFCKAKEEGKDFYKCLIIHCIIPLTSNMQSPMQILQGRNARSDLPMSNVARKQLGIQPEEIGNSDKYAVLHNSASKHWYPAVIDSFCPELRSYKTSRRDGIVYRKTQSILKPFTLQNKMSQSTQ